MELFFYWNAFNIKIIIKKIIKTSTNYNGIAGHERRGT
jgi:hypothetical protein